jgi:hypothetical protein
MSGSGSLSQQPAAEAERPLLRYAVMVDSTLVPAWAAKALEYVESGGDANAVIILMRDPRDTRTTRARSPGSRRPISTRLTAKVLDVLARRLWNETGRLIEIMDQLAGVDVRLFTTTSTIADTRTLPDTDCDALRALDLDFILWLGRTELDGSVLTVARNGVWSFRHGLDQDPGTPIGFWEIHDRDATSVAVLQQLTPVGNAQVTLRGGTFAVAPGSIRRSRDRLLLGSSAFPAVVARHLRRGLQVGATQQAPNHHPSRTAPGMRNLLRFAWHLASARLISAFHQSIHVDHWNVGIVDAGVTSFVGRTSSPEVRWAPERRGRYAADPFGWMEDSRCVVVFEDYDHVSGKATIARSELDGSGRWSTPKPALDVGGHLSYPSIVNLEGERLMLPEARAVGSVALYGSADHGRTRRRRATLLDRSDVSDATVLHHDGRWWMFGAQGGLLNPDTDLLLWHAPNLTGPWTEHAGNPIKTDVRTARPAGPPFVVDGQLYRPAQDCSSSYGARVRIQRVVTLNDREYQEEEAGVVEPQADGSYPLGLHTLTGVGDLTLVDGKRRTLSLRATLRIVTARFRSPVQVGATD